MAIQTLLERQPETRSLGYAVYDGDGHLYETQDTFRRHLPKQFHSNFQYVEVEGRTKLAINGHISEYIPNPTFEVVAAPGTHEIWYRGENHEGKTLRELTGVPLAYQPEFGEPEARLKLLDEQGVHAQLIFPTLASIIEGHMGNNVELMAALVHSLNAWVLDEWSFNYKNRLFPCAYISLADVDAACAELEWALKHGAKHILIRPAPVPGVFGSRSPGAGEFDKFWARVNESGVFVVLHVSDSGYDQIYRWWGSGGKEMVARRQRNGCFRSWRSVEGVHGFSGSRRRRHDRRTDFPRRYGQISEDPLAVGRKRLDLGSTSHENVQASLRAAAEKFPARSYRDFPRVRLCRTLL